MKKKTKSESALWMTLLSWTLRCQWQCLVWRSGVNETTECSELAKTSAKSNSVWKYRMWTKLPRLLRVMNENGWSKFSCHCPFQSLKRYSVKCQTEQYLAADWTTLPGLSKYPQAERHGTESSQLYSIRIINQTERYLTADWTFRGLSECIQYRSSMWHVTESLARQNSTQHSHHQYLYY